MQLTRTERTELRRPSIESDDGRSYRPGFIPAIKSYKARMSCSLREARKYIEQMLQLGVHLEPFEEETTEWFMTLVPSVPRVTILRGATAQYLIEGGTMSACTGCDAPVPMEIVRLAWKVYRVC